jgi:HSP20 family protein
MSNVTRWNPTRDLMSFNDAINRLFDEAFVMPRGGTMAAPNVDVVEKGDHIEVKAELPGWKPENIDIRVEGDLLTIRGEFKTENEKQEEGKYHMREIRQGSFARSVQLPSWVNTEKSEAIFDNGVLTLSLPKNEAHMPKKINVLAKNNK